MATLGSGEGIAKQYAYRDAKTKEIVTVTDTLLFNDTEIESVEALAKRGGSSLMSQWRKTFTGEQLGFGYADPKHRIPVRDHKYRFCQILGIQPELAEWLLTGTQAAAGTPQRILWAPVVYPDMPRPTDLPAWPGQKKLPAWPSPAGESRVRFRCGGSVDKPTDENLLREHELKVPSEVETIVREARWRFHRGKVDDLSGHSTLTRLKVAAGLMWLDGHTDAISLEDWELAGVVMQISDQTRAEIQDTLSDRRKRTDIARGRSDAVREIAKAGVIGEEKIARIADGIRRKLRDKNGQSVRNVKKWFRSDDREYVDPALERLVAVGDVELEPIEYKGNPGHIVWLKEGR